MVDGVTKKIGAANGPESAPFQKQAVQTGQADGRGGLHTFYANRMYSGVEKLSDAQWRMVDSVVEDNNCINKMLDAAEETDQVAADAEFRAFQINYALLWMTQERSFTSSNKIEAVAAKSPSAVAKPSIPNDAYFQEVSTLLDDGGEDAVTADNVRTRMPNASELNASIKRYSNDNVKYLGTVNMTGNLDAVFGLGTLLKTLNEGRVDGVTRIASLRDADGPHFVTIMARNGELCVFDSLPPVKDPDEQPEKNPKSSGEKAVELISNMLRKNEDLLFDPDKVELVQERLQQHNDDGEGTWLVNSCPLFSLWLQEYASKEGIKDQPLLTTVTGFAEEISAKSKAEKDTINLETRLGMLEAVRESSKELGLV